MGEYTLTHFNTRFLAEPIRFIFSYAQVPFNDVKIDVDEFQRTFDDHPWNQLPKLELPDGTILSQSASIAQYLGQEFNLCGTERIHAVKCVEVSDCLRDLRAAWRKYFFERNRERKEFAKSDFIEGPCGKFLGGFNKWAANNENNLLICDQVTWADLTLATTLGFLQDTVDKQLLDPYPNLVKLKEYIWNIPQVASYIENRPKPMVAMLHVVPIGV